MEIFLLRLQCLIVLLVKSISTAQNSQDSLDINFVTVMHEGFSENRSSHFGYTTSLAPGSDGTSSGWIFVGAPKSNVTIIRPKSKGTYFEPGVIWRCNLDPIVQKCEILHFLDQYCADRVSKNSENFGQCNSNFMGGSLIMDKGILVACAPNWNRERKKSQSGLRMDGACYWMRQNVALSDHLTSELANRKEDSQRGNLIPFQDPSYSHPDTAYWKEHSFLRWYYADTGLSIHVTNSADIVLGAVATHYTRGSMLKVQGKEYKKWGLTNLETFTSNKNYFRNFGYAVTSGNYLDPKETLYAASSPGADSKSELMSGLILIITAESFLPSGKFKDADKIERNYALWREKYQLAGKFGSYFGAALQSIDINGDGLEELLVGAPLEDISGLSLKDYGCVYIYTALGRNEFTNNDNAKKVCGKDPRGRFGTSIASLGDLNQDGFNDFAVGAPYGESGGAVYIYYGDKDLSLRPFTIQARAYKPQLTFSTFGFSITGGVDLDGNGTPDLCIGSYADKQVAILRTRPRMDIRPTLLSYAENRALDPIILEKDARNFTIELCVRIKINSNTKELRHADKTVIHGRIAIDVRQKPQRFTIEGKNVVNTSFIFPWSESEVEVCRNFSVERAKVPNADQLEGQQDVDVEYILWYNQTLKKDPMISVLEIQNDANIPKILATGPQIGEFCTNCPYPVTTDPIQSDLTFKKECRSWKENSDIPVCRPNLTVTITGRYGEPDNLIYPLSGRDNNLTFGDAPWIEVHVQVKNRYQTAYFPKIKLTWGWDSSELVVPQLLGKTDVCSVKNDNGTAICKLDRVKTYLGTNITQTQSFRLNLQQRNSPVTSKSKRFDLKAEVYLESDNSSENVSASLTINHIVNASINLMDGSLSNNSFPIQMAGQLNYQFKARVVGTTPVRGTIKFLLPDSISWKGQNIRIFTIDRPSILSCTPIPLTDPVFKDYGTKLSKGKGTFGTLYGKSHCQALSCSFDVTRRERFLDMRFDVKILDLGLIREVLELEGAMNFFGMAHAQLLDFPPMANVTRLIINPPDQSGIPGWILLAAAFGGLVFLILIIFGLAKCGFFKRGVKERLDEMKAQAEAETELIVDEVPSQVTLEEDAGKSDCLT